MFWVTILDHSREKNAYALFWARKEFEAVDIYSKYNKNSSFSTMVW